MKVFCLTFFLLIAGSAYAQYKLEAVVIDGMTRKPVVNAHVYLDGTTVGTSTDAQGRFSLRVSQVINTSLVISFVGYEKIIIQNPFKSLPKTVFMEENINTLNEVTVKGKRDTRKRWEMLQLFKIHFFGHNVYSCRIRNENDILLTHDAEKGELIATARKPLEIVNNHLKYYIQFNLEEFKIIFSRAEKKQKPVRNTQRY